MNSISYNFQISYNTTENIFGENNYYFTNDITLIEDLIFDKTDVDPSLQTFYGEVFFNPYLNEEVSNAGIMSNTYD